MEQRYSRIDVQAFDGVEASTGWLRAPARITRTGVFDYHLDDGSVRRELRHPDWVFDARSLETLEMVPVTLGHPREFLNANTTRDHQVGYTGQEITTDGLYVTAPLCITDHTTIAAIKSGIKEVSAGYSFQGLDMTSGIWEGQPYDCIQLGPYVYNHVAVVPKGRAGPEVHVLDDAGAIRMDGESMVKLKIGDADYEVPQQVADEFKAMTDRCNDLQAKLDKKAKADDDGCDDDEGAAAAAEEDARSDAAEFLRGVEAGKARAALEVRLAPVLGVNYAFDGKDDAAVVADALAKLVPDLNVAGKSADYLHARLDAALDASRMDAYKPLATTVTGNPADPTAKALAEFAESQKKLAASYGK